SPRNPRSEPDDAEQRDERCREHEPLNESSNGNVSGNATHGSPLKKQLTRGMPFFALIKSRDPCSAETVPSGWPRCPTVFRRCPATRRRCCAQVGPGCSSPSN